MKSIFEIGVSQEIATRIDNIDDSNRRLWGKMDLFQMLKHCTKCEDMILGKINIKRVFIGRLIGKLILNKVLNDDKPFGRNSPTAPVLKTLNQTGDIEQQKKEWLQRIGEYESFSNLNFIHPFFGSMTKEQIGVFAYKHADHHLRQFGA